ncbi:HAD family hydrolase [Pirellulales bacterium]|nr:HAD family hydrolase [Pirellulales bacterium]
MAGLLAITDPVKPGAHLAIHQLKRLGITVTMLTGDHADSANVIALSVGIDHYKASVNVALKARLKLFATLENEIYRSWVYALGCNVR